MSDTSGRGVTIGLMLLLSGKLLFHALYVPAFEGPDEPFHLGRVRELRRRTALQRG